MTGPRTAPFRLENGTILTACAHLLVREDVTFQTDSISGRKYAIIGGIVRAPSPAEQCALGTWSSSQMKILDPPLISIKNCSLCCVINYCLLTGVWLMCLQCKSAIWGKNNCHKCQSCCLHMCSSISTNEVCNVGLRTTFTGVSVGVETFSRIGKSIIKIFLCLTAWCRVNPSRKGFSMASFTPSLKWPENWLISKLSTRDIPNNMRCNSAFRCRRVVVACSTWGWRVILKWALKCLL